MTRRTFGILFTIAWVLLGLSLPLIAAQATGYGAARLVADAAGALAHLAGGGRWLP